MQKCTAWKNIYMYGVKNEMYWMMKNAGGVMDFHTGVRTYNSMEAGSAGVTVYSLPTEYTMADLTEWGVKVCTDCEDTDGGEGKDGKDGDGKDGTDGDGEKPEDKDAGTEGTEGGAAALMAAATAIAAMLAF